MGDDDHPSKRRRLENGYVDSPMDSSSDELAAASDHEPERRRVSWSKQKAHPSTRKYTRSPSLSDSGSPDELAVDADTYWRESMRERERARNSTAAAATPTPATKRGARAAPAQKSRGVDQSPKDLSSQRSYDGEAEEDEGEVDGEVDEEEGDANNIKHDNTNDDENNEEEMQDVQQEEDNQPGEDSNNNSAPDHAERTPTPPPPPPPPKPERLNYKLRSILKGHLRGVSQVKFSPDGSMIASGGADCAVKVWDTLTGKLIHTFEGHLAGISTVAWSPDGETIASGSDDKSIRLWNVLTGKAHPIPFIGHHNYVYAIAFSPKGNMLVSGSYDEAVFLWDVRSARVMRSLPAHSDPVAGIDVVYDGTLIASCAGDGLIRIWDTMTGQCLRTLVHEDNPPVTAVRFSPNGKFVLAWTLDNCVRLWDYVEGRCIKTYQGHVNRKYSLSGGFGVYGAPGGKPEAFAVSGSEDGAVLCWDVVSKKTLQRIEGHTDVVLCVDTCKVGDRRLMVSCGLDRTVRIWEEVEENADDEAQGATDNNNNDEAGEVNGDNINTTNSNNNASSAVQQEEPAAMDTDMDGEQQQPQHHGNEMIE
ncbi:hypothetical protein VTN00DRAFT_4774 [Thermoascus crustaceus]|uniref:uncharacterized protein n=1 Tax=Thermoascus crustaceus TaxID=5088 RepID=UPI00374244A0